MYISTNSSHFLLFLLIPLILLLSLVTSQQNHTNYPLYSSPPPSTFYPDHHHSPLEDPDDIEPPLLPLPLPVRGKGITIGNRNKTETARRRPSWRQPTTTTLSSVKELPPLGGPAVDGSLYVGLILPYSMFHRRSYLTIVNMAMSSLKQKSEYEALFARHFKEEPAHHMLIRMITFSPSPRGKESH